jgi:hypothetical protein
MYCRHLNLDFNLDTSVLENIKESYKDLHTTGMFKIEQPDIDSVLSKFLYKLNIAIYSAQIFYTNPNGGLFVHMDIKELGQSNCKLNWVYGGTGSTMEWWERNDPTEPLEYKFTRTGAKYIYFDRNKCRKIYEEEIKQPSLVNAGIPHSVSNLGNEGRWCLSYSLYDLNKNQNLEWEDAIEKLSNWSYGPLEL